MGGSTALLEEIRETKKNLSLSSKAILTAHTNFTNQYNTFLTLTEKLENEFTELEIKENDVKKRDDEVPRKTDQLVEREKKCVEKENELKEREKHVNTKEGNWAETEKSMAQNASKLPTVVHLNVSGTRFSVKKEALLRHEGSLLAQILTNNHSQQLPTTGEVFIDRDPKLFEHIIRFLVHRKLTSQDDLDLKMEFEHFRIPFGISIKSPLLHGSDFAYDITEWLPNRKFQLLYKATTDGFEAEDFHNKCDNKGSTLTLIRSANGYLFGGYSVLPWDSTTEDFKNHSEGFIFTLSNPHNIPPSKYPHDEQNPQSIYCISYCGPTFGTGFDIYVGNDSHQDNESYTNFPKSYVDTTGKGNNTFTGARNFVTSDIEVFSVI